VAYHDGLHFLVHPLHVHPPVQLPLLHLGLAGHHLPHAQQDFLNTQSNNKQCLA